ncbi:hypothetical protein BK784_15760 [Bacillus thuringiensis serovar medellin]|uniref:Uncharacterized protein n=1 Tax=Bacillus thuringiensis subsp. medellin TaxID=79672 RepID=A0A9X6RG47_BACTV|nr:hypothetical protein BK784_15760 [Bacillus thuringiensis serovar medellin]
MEVELLKRYEPYMGKHNVKIGEILVFKFRTLSNAISEIIGEVISFGVTKDGIEYLEVDVGSKRTKKYVI